MKRFIISGILLLISITTCIAQSFYLEKSIKNLCYDMSVVKNDYENNNDTADSIAICFEHWEKSRKILSVFINHNQLEQISSKLTELQSFALSSDSEFELMSTINQVTHLGNELLDNERISFSGVF